MTRSLYLIPAFASLITLGACSSFEDRYQASLPGEQRHPIEVSTDVAVLDVATDSRGALTSRSRSEIDLFMRGYKAEGNGVLEIHTTGGSTEIAATQIRDLALVNGISANKLTRRSYAAQPGSNTAIRIAFARYVATVPSCTEQDWSEDIGKTWDNTPYASFGCATQMNVAAQVSDPRDVLTARPMDAASADRRGTIFDKYEKGQKTGAENESDNDSEVSTVAK